MSNDNRVNPTENEKILLFNEVNGICPICVWQLMYEKNWKKGKLFEIAHIYPANPTDEEKEILKNVEKLNDDINHIDNLICLCRDCHKKFDNPRTIEEYDKMVELKKQFIIKNKEVIEWDQNKLEKEINEIINFLSENIDNLEDYNIIEYDPKTLENKSNSTMSSLIKRKIKYNIDDYYFLVKSKFIDTDKKIPSTTEKISIQIKLYYLKMKDLHSKQDDIFIAIVDWMHIITNKKSKEASEIIVSYFIQNCEIF